MNTYYTLIVSLPRHCKHFKVKQTPISAIQLEKRLRLLSKQELKIIYDLMSVVWDSWFSCQQSLNETRAQAEPLHELNNPFITRLIDWFFDIRSILVALRIRKIQKNAPTNLQNECITHWHLQLIKNWSEPDFGLKSIYPWLPDLANQFLRNETANVEDSLLTQLWYHLNIIEDRHYFDFEAVIIYLLRWKIVNYYSQFNEVAAAEKINNLVKGIISNYKN